MRSWWAWWAWWAWWVWWAWWAFLSFFVRTALTAVGKQVMSLTEINFMFSCMFLLELASSGGVQCKVVFPLQGACTQTIVLTQLHQSFKRHTGFSCGYDLRWKSSPPQSLHMAALPCTLTLQSNSAGRPIFAWFRIMMGCSKKLS